MRVQDHSPPSMWPLVVSWAGNAIAFLAQAATVLQVVALLFTIAYTALKLYRLWNTKGATE